MNINPEKNERLLLVAVLALLLVAMLGPFVAQPAHQHAFADQRAWGFIPCAMDVLSNLSFALWGLAGMAGVAWLRRRRAAPVVDTSQGHFAMLFFAGLLLTAAASAFYHWQPDDAGLAVDRLGMVVAFAGLIGLAASDRISDRAGMALSLMVLILGPLSVWAWSVSGNVLYWAVLQFGAMVLVSGLAFLQPLPGALAIRWLQVILIYATAKLLEQADASIYMSSTEMVSGHSLKHVVASCAAWPVVAAMLRAGKSGQNPVHLAEGGRSSQAAARALPQNN